MGTRLTLSAREQRSKFPFICLVLGWYTFHQVVKTPKKLPGFRKQCERFDVGMGSN